MSTSTRGKFGKLLQLHRRNASLTQQELAERAKLSVRGISDLERGYRQWPHRWTVEMLATALDLSDEEHAEMVAAARRPLAALGDRVALEEVSWPVDRRASVHPMAPTFLNDWEKDLAVLPLRIRRSASELAPVAESSVARRTVATAVADEEAPVELTSGPRAWELDVRCVLVTLRDCERLLRQCAAVLGETCDGELATLPRART